MRIISCHLFILIALTSSAKVWIVSPTGTYTTPRSVSTLVSDGDTIYIDAAIYSNHPQVSLSKDNLFIKGINGRPRLEAGNALASNSNGKAIFVISGQNCRVENIEFANASVPDNNGAGIRQEGCDLYVSYCFFNGNEMGILGGNYSPCKVVIEHCVFANNGSTSNPGFQHNIYINHIDTFVFRYNFTVDAIAEGHELKSRAHHNIITYNYIANLSTNDSRNIDLPNGGTALLMGNIIEQAQSSVNSNMLGFGLEGLTNTGPHNLWLVNNTFVNKKNKGSFVQISNGSDTLFMKNNILAGPKTGGLLIGSAKVLDSSNNYINDDLSGPGFIDPGKSRYELTNTSPCINSGASITKIVDSYLLKPAYQYKDTASFEIRPNSGVIDIGGFELAGTIGIDQLGAMKNYFYPNPVMGAFLFSESDKPLRFELYSVNGAFAMGGMFIQGKADLRELPPGMYLIKITDSFFRLVRE